MESNAFVKSLGAGIRQQLTRKSNAAGFGYLVPHAGAIVLLGWLIHSRITLWPLLLVLQGILIVFLFTLMHETTHKTAFATRSLNVAIAFLCGIILLLPPEWFRHFHFSHHKHTQDPGRDPELSTPKPGTPLAYAIHVSGIPVWLSQLRTLFISAQGHANHDYVPAKRKHAITAEARRMLGIYLLLAIGSVITKSTMLFYVWLLPALLGQPFLRLFLLAEHGRCAFASNMFQNTRTTFTNGMIRRLAWNMPYHTEHHVYPMVPFHRLVDLHELMKEHLVETEKGYTSFNRRYLQNVSKSAD